jgi:hypothetical protein
MRRCAAILLLALMACGAPTGPADVAVYHLDPATGSYVLSPQRLSTVEDLDLLRGAAAETVGGAKIEIDSHAATAAQQLAVTDPGGEVDAQFEKRGSAWWPLDYHSLDLATTYFNLERSRAYARARGLGDQLDRLRVYYLPRMTIRGSQGVFTDNAAFVSSLHAMVLPPFASLQDIPLSMNRGVVSHEYGHAIFNALVHRGAAVPDFTERWCPGDQCAAPQGWVMMGIVEEGFADTWGTASTGDPRFLRRSIPQVGSSRDVVPFDPAAHCTSQAELAADINAHDLSVSYWSGQQYRYGTVWAAALWRAGLEPGTSHEQVMDALLASYEALGEIVRSDTTGAEFGSFATIAGTIAAHAPDDATRRALCTSMRARLGLGADAPASCADVTPLEDCS